MTTNENEFIFGLAEKISVEEGTAVHKYLMGKEIKKLADTITSMGETAHPKLHTDAIEEDKEWNKLLDDLFEKVADFAETHGYGEIVNN